MIESFNFHRNAEQVIGGDELAERISGTRPLRVKLGVDPTRPDLTFGHLVVFNKLREFQEHGHEAILIIGDFTAMIGDPSGRSATRPPLTREEVRANADTYLEQAFKILDRQRTTVRYNSEWFSKMSFADCLDLSRRMTVARMLERDDFSKRYQSNTPISIVEFLYPLIQGYDSVVLRADVELGGSDQLFNMLVGRALQTDQDQPPQAVITMPLLVGLDGERKMSKSYDNYIAFNDSPKEMFGKIMSISDQTMWDYYRLLLGYDEAALKLAREGHPMEAKKSLASELLNRFHGAESGERERAAFEQVFSRGENPDDMPVVSISSFAAEGPVFLDDAMVASGLFPSRKEAVRLIEQGSVRVDGERVTERKAELAARAEGPVVQAGKRRFFRLAAS